MGSSRRNNYTTQRARQLGFRSGLEQKTAEELDCEKDITYEFEGLNNEFIWFGNVVNGCVVDRDNLSVDIPQGSRVAQRRKYTCDFRIVKKDGSVMFIETKGYFKAADRTKHEALKKQYPDIDLRIVFSSNGWWSKAKRTRYSDWAEKKGITYHISKKSDGYIIPKEWLE